MNIDWTNFTLTQYVRADKETIYKLLSTTKGIESWFRQHTKIIAPTGEVRTPGEVIQPGDLIEWYHYEGDSIERGKFIELDPKKGIKWFFDSDFVTTTFILDEKDGITKVQLYQANMPDTPKAHFTWHASCRQGWTVFLMNMKSVVEHGIDLREKDPKLDFDYNSSF